MIGGRENGRENRTGLSGAPAAAWSLSAEARRVDDLRLFEPITIVNLSRYVTVTSAIASPTSVHETVHEQNTGCNV
jgi:hypothetical protein